MASVAVDQVGAPELTALSHWLAEPAAVELYADVDVAKITPHWVGAVEVPVPPEPTAKAVDNVVTPFNVIVLVPDVVPIIMVLVPVPDPPVPMLIALIWPATAPVPMLVVEAPVTDVPKLKFVFAEKLAVVPLNVAVALATVTVPAVDPMLKVVAAPKIVAVVAEPNTAKEDGLAAEKTVAKPEEPLITVAFGNDTVVLLIEAVPAEEPIPRVVAAPKIVAVVADPNTAKEDGLAAEKTVARADEPLIVVAFGNDTVALLIEPVPVEAPKLKVVAAPNTAKEDGLAVANTDARADEPLIVVAFGNDTVVLLIEVVPVEEPIPRVVAAPKIVAVVAAPNTAKDEGLAAEKTVAKPDEPLIVVAFGKLIVAFLNVPVPEVAPIVNDVAAPKIVAVVAAPNTAKAEGLAEENTVAKPEEPLIVVAFGKSIVAFLNVPVPEVAPIVNDVAAPKIVAVVAAPNTAKAEGLAEENTVAKPEEPLIVVALVKSTVAFLI